MKNLAENKFVGPKFKDFLKIKDWVIFKKPNLIAQILKREVLVFYPYNNWKKEEEYIGNEILEQYKNFNTIKAQNSQIYFLDKGQILISSNSNIEFIPAKWRDENNEQCYVLAYYKFIKPPTIYYGKFKTWLLISLLKIKVYVESSSTQNI